ncbi:hypothetical protein AWC26_00980 [Mycobacterium shimoidei]|nr:hypothetical protein BHQ16_22330 [Mycobacterium shimoidei]ORW82397.1 hypothetical protein AWC26_00980 [Mycobacterium shimoidei]
MGLAAEAVATAVAMAAATAAPAVISTLPLTDPATTDHTHPKTARQLIMMDRTRMSHHGMV